MKNVLYKRMCHYDIRIWEIWVGDGNKWFGRFWVKPKEKYWNEVNEFIRSSC